MRDFFLDLLLPAAANCRHFLKERTVKYESRRIVTFLELPGKKT